MVLEAGFYAIPVVASGVGLAEVSGGKYKHLEPEGVRKKHWKAAERQRGHVQVFNQ